MPYFRFRDIFTVTPRLSHCPHGNSRSAGIDTVAKSDKWHRDRPDATFHSLRHTFVSRCIEAGIPIEFVRELVGHTTQTMTSHYSHISPEAMAAALEKMNVQ